MMAFRLGGEGTVVNRLDPFSEGRDEDSPDRLTVDALRSHIELAGEGEKLVPPSAA
jgi:hypothetical protein